jgi:hypothetical protein
MADILYQSSHGIIGEDLVARYEIRRVPRGNKQIFLTPEGGEDVVNTANPNEQVDVMWLAFDKTIDHNVVFVRNGAPLEATRTVNFRVPDSGRFGFPVSVLLGLGFVAGDTIQYSCDGILSNPLTAV